MLFMRLHFHLADLGAPNMSVMGALVADRRARSARNCHISFPALPLPASSGYPPPKSRKHRYQGRNGTDGDAGYRTGRKRLNAGVGLRRGRWAVGGDVEVVRGRAVVSVGDQYVEYVDERKIELDGRHDPGEPRALDTTWVSCQRDEYGMVQPVDYSRSMLPDTASKLPPGQVSWTNFSS